MSELIISTPFSLADAAAAGVSPGEVRALVRRGDVREVVRGAYVSVDIPDSVGLRAEALSYVVPPREGGLSEPRACSACRTELA